MWPPASQFGPAAPGAVWDEYQWEAFIRRQDAHAAEYMALVDYYGEEGDAHNLIARAMGWQHVLTACGAGPDRDCCRECAPDRQDRCNFHAHWLACAEDGQADPSDTHDDAEGAEDRAADVLPVDLWQGRYAGHAVRELASGLACRLHGIAAARQDAAQPCARPFDRLLHHAARCAGKVAAALPEDILPAHLGMVIAHLKAAFQAASAALGWIELCAASGLLGHRDAQTLTGDLLEIRGHLADLIADLRGLLIAVRERMGSA